MTKTSAWTADSVSSRSSGKRAPLLRSCSLFAAAIALAGLWSPAAQAQLAAPVATRTVPAMDAQSIRQTRNAPEVRSIASGPFMADARISIDPPVVPNTQPPMRDTSGSMPGSLLPNNAGGDQHQVIAGSAGSVVIIGAPAPVVAPRANGTVSAQGSFTVTSGAATINRDAVKDQIQVTTPQAIINWTTFDTATLAATDSYINFLPAGTELEFIGTGSDYTVLNRIFGTPDGAGQFRGIGFEGTVTSRLSDAGPISGNVWFYSPGGILLSSTARFNIGSLVLSASAIDAITGSGTSISFNGVSQPDSAVLIQNGVVINAVNRGSYVAVVAPRVEQAGTIFANGSVAYVGAEQAQLTIDNGLFDIAVTLGTEDANGVVHTGTTTGLARQVVQGTNNILVDPDGHGIYMVAVPKNTALTMLVGGSIGYQPAGGASLTPNGLLVLSAGSDVQSSVDIRSGTQTVQFDGRDAVPGANIAFTGGNLTSDLQAFASGQTGIEVGNNQAFAIGGDARGAYSLTMAGGKGVRFGAVGSGTIDIAGNVTLIGGDDQATGAPITIFAEADPGNPTGPGGSIAIGGNLIANSLARGRDDFFIVRQNGNTGIGEDAVAGDISLNISGGGNLTVDGFTILDASAQGGKGEFVNGSSTGGGVSISLSGATSSLNLANSVSVQTSAIDTSTGKFGGNGTGLLGSDSIAGDFSLVATGGALDLGFVQIDTAATATSGGDSSQAQENSATSGSGTFSFTGGTQNIDGIQMFSGARAGQSFDAAGNSFDAPVTLGGLTFLMDGSLTSIAQDFRVFANTGFNDPSNATDTQFTITNGANVSLGGDFAYFTNNLKDSVTLTVDQGSRLDIDGSLGFSFRGNTSDIDSDRGVDITINVNNAALLANFVNLDSSIENDSFGNLDILGGDIAINLANSALFDAGFAIVASNAQATAAGSSATGGNVTISVNSSTFRATGGLDISANGLAALSNIDTTNGTSFGRGGNVRFVLGGENPNITIGDLGISADGRFNAGFEEAGFLVPLGGPGGSSGGGIVALDAPLAGGGIGTLAAPLAGGGGLGDGGSAAGGSVEVTINSGTFTADDVAVTSSGFGEEGSSGIIDDGVNPPVAYAGDGGDGTGGTVTFNLNGGTANYNSLEVSANGLGGQGAFSDTDTGTPAGNGGNGTGGTATINASSGVLDVTEEIALRALGNAQIFDFGFPFVSTGGSGGSAAGVAGGQAGNGFGGTAIFNLLGTAQVSADTIEVSADAYGGDGGTSFSDFTALGPVPGSDAGAGGAATGGSAIFNNTSGSISFNNLTVTSSGEGGQGGGSFGVTTGGSVSSGGDGGAGNGGIATINLNQDDGSDPSYAVIAAGSGGQGGGGLDSGAGGDASGGTARLNVNNANINLTGAFVDASASGGNGGFVDGENGQGGDGGSAVGGDAILVVDGINAALTADSSVNFFANGFGGLGADGGSNQGDLDTTGDGGRGGDGTGGTIQLLATNGGSADFAINTAINARGIGGGGGTGGDAFSFVAGNGGDAGTGTGGSITVSATGSSSIIISGFGPGSQVELDAAGAGGAGGDGGFGASSSTGMVGGNGASQGGAINLISDGGQLAFAGTLVANVSATGLDDFRSGAIGADATGGTINIEALAGSIFSTTGGILADASGTAAVGRAADGAMMAGSGSGGTVEILFADGSTADASSITVLASGSGRGSTSGATQGGAGTGGNVTVELATDLPNLASILIDVSAFGGTGGNAVAAGPGARGGSAVGGSGSVLAAGTGSLLGALGDLTIAAMATGGNGGAGANGTATVNGAMGGAGGSATGGSASFQIAGNGATFTFDQSTTQLMADATGGAGGAGGSNFTGGTLGDPLTGFAGNGGTGGDGTGGEVLVGTGSGATLSLIGNGSDPLALVASGFGGQGGTGGDIDMVNGGVAGNGGDGGIGTGGSPVLQATGGTITAGQTQLIAQGFGGNGGTGGDDSTVTLGLQGNGGMGVGGRPRIEVFDGSPGIITLGDVLIDATAIGGGGTFNGSTAGGQIILTDASSDPGGLISMAALTVLATGSSPQPGTPSLTITGGSGPITVTGPVNANVAGDIILDFDADGQLLVGGSAALTAGGDLIVSHTNNTADTISLEVGGNILAQILGNIDAQVESIISGNEVFLIAGGNASIDDVRGIPSVQIIAGGNALVNDALAVGPQGISNFGGILIEAGRNAFGMPFYDPTVEARITGTVDSYASISVLSGGNAVFAAGSETIANNAISVTTGDDIIVESGATLTSARNPSILPDQSDPFNGVASISLNAGGITSFLSTPLTPLASIVVDGSLDAGTGAIIAQGAAIDGLDGSFTGSSLSLDVRDAPADGVPQSDDAGLLSANCLQGNICLGTISADNVIEIGQGSNNDVIQLIIQQGTVNANEILITTRNDIVMGTDGIATTLGAGNLFSLTSLQGDVDLREAAISSDQILIEAAGSLIGSGSLASGSDIGITVGGSLLAASIDTGGELTTVADVGGGLEGFYSVGGDIAIGSLSVGAGDVNYSAGGNIDIGAANVLGTDIILNAPGLVQLGFTGSASSIDLDGGFVSVGDIFAGNQIGIVSGSDVQIGSATAGDTLTVDSAGNVSFSGLQAGSDLTVTAPGSISGGDLIAGSLSLDGGFIAIGSASASAINFVSASDILFDLLQSPSAILLTAANGMIAAHTGSGDIESDGDVTLEAQLIAIGNVTSGGTVEANATVGNASFGTIDAANDITVTAAGSPTLANAISGGDTNITGQSVTFNNGTIGGNLALTASAGDILSDGTVTVGGGIVLDADGDVSFGSLAAQGGDFTITAGGNIFANHAEASGDFNATGGGSFTTGLNSIITGGDILISVVDIVNLGNSSAGGLIDVLGSQIDFANLDAGSNIALRTEVSTSTNAGNGNIAGGTITAGSGASSLESAGAINLTGTTIIEGSLILNAAGEIVFPAVDVQGGDFIAVSGAQIAHGGATASGTIDFTAQNDIQGTGDLLAGGDLQLESLGGSVIGRAFSAGSDAVIDATNEVSFDGVSAGGAIGIDAGGAVAGQSLAAGGSINVQSGQMIVIDSVAAAGSGLGGVSMVGLEGITLQTLSGTEATLRATNGAVRVNQDVALTNILFADGQSIFVRSTHDLAVDAAATLSTIDIETSGDLDVEQATAPSDIRLFSTGGTATISDVSSGGFVPPPGTQGTLQVTSGSDVSIFGANNVVILDTVNATGNLNIEADNLVDVRALVSGTVIEILSADIAIAATGAIGEHNRTDEITFNAFAGDVTLGGAGGSGAGFELDNAEFARVFSGGNVILNAVGISTGGATVTIDDLDVTAAAGTSATGGNIGQTGRLQVFGGSINVIGEAVIVGATADTVLALNSATDVFLDATTGLLELQSAPGNYTGSIIVEAENFYAMTPDALADIQNLSIADIDVRLGDSEGLDNPDGVIRAGTLDITTTTSDVFIQNTVPGTAFADRRGFTVDQLNIADPNTTSQPIVINGTIGSATGVDAVPLANITSTFDPGSTINGCLIANPSSCVTVIDHNDDSSSDTPLQDLLEEEFDGEPVVGAPLDPELVEMREDPLRADDPLIDEPVTGAGNEDLWEFEGDEEECERDDSGACIAVAAE